MSQTRKMSFVIISDKNSIVSKWKWWNKENAADKVWWTYFVFSTYNVVVSQPSPVAGCIHVMEAAIQSEQVARLEHDMVR